MVGMITLFILLLTILLHISLLLNIVIAVNPTGFSMKMFHRDSKESPFYPGDHLTQDERFQRLVKQSKDRARYIGRKMYGLRNTINPDFARLPMTYENVGSSYVALVGIGTFGSSGTHKQYFLTVDTGSDLIWIQCDGGRSYYPQRDPLYPATSSRTYRPLPCRSQSGGRNPDCYTGLCDDHGRCIYRESYQDGAETSGILAMEKFSVSTDTLGTQPFSILMGCGLNQVNFHSNGREVGAGILGLNGPKSFLSQLNLGKFEYCLRPYTDGNHGLEGTSTYLRFGRDTILDRRVRRAYTTKLYDHGKGHYFLVLNDISVNGSSAGFEREDFDYEDYNGNGGCLIDSGTTMTMMHPSHLDKVAEKVKAYFRNFQVYPVIPSPVNGLDLCFRKHGRRIVFPKITFHFEGANFELRADEEDTSFWINDDYVCLGFLPIPDDDVITYDVMIGAMQQARKRILYDVVGESLYFAQEDCRRDNIQSI